LANVAPLLVKENAIDPDQALSRLADGGDRLQLFSAALMGAKE
jgi:hypothetical protein